MFVCLIKRGPCSFAKCGGTDHRSGARITRVNGRYHFGGRGSIWGSLLFRRSREWRKFLLIHNDLHDGRTHMRRLERLVMSFFDFSPLVLGLLTHRLKTTNA